MPFLYMMLAWYWHICKLCQFGIDIFANAVSLVLTYLLIVLGWYWQYCLWCKLSIVIAKNMLTAMKRGAWGLASLFTLFSGLCYKTHYGRNLWSYVRNNTWQCYTTLITVIWPYCGEMVFFCSPLYCEEKSFKMDICWPW